MACSEAVVLIAAMKEQQKRVALKMQTNERLSKRCKKGWKCKENS